MITTIELQLQTTDQKLHEHTATYIILAPISLQPLLPLMIAFTASFKVTLLCSFCVQFISTLLMYCCVCYTVDMIHITARHTYASSAVRAMQRTLTLYTSTAYIPTYTLVVAISM
jgi:hypothetical protein